MLFLALITSIVFSISQFITAIRASTWVVTASSSPTSLSTWLPNTFSFSQDLETSRQPNNSLQATVRPNEQTKLHWLLAEQLSDEAKEDFQQNKLS